MNLYPVFSYPDENQCPQKGVDLRPVAEGQLTRRAANDR